VVVVEVVARDRDGHGYAIVASWRIRSRLVIGW
jgi:hypothetical protein